MSEIHIISIRTAEQLPQELCRTLFPKRMERAGKFLKTADRYRCIAAGALMAAVLGTGEDGLCINRWGKPGLKDGRLCFSVSHSGDYAVLAVDTGEVGTDIEKQTPVLPPVAERVFTEEELLWMNREPQSRFFQLWTMKESVLKLDGRGFSLPPERFSVLPLLQGRAHDPGCGNLYGFSQMFRDCALSVCSRNPIRDLPVKEYSPAEITERLKEVNHFVSGSGTG